MCVAYNILNIIYVSSIKLEITKIYSNKIQFFIYPALK